MNVGHQTFSWEMLGAQWKGAPDDILDAVAAAGYQGVEFSSVMIGSYWDRPEEFRRALERHGLVLAAFAFAAEDGFTDATRAEADLAGADKAIAFAACFSAPVCLAGPSSASRDDAPRKVAHACELYSEIARRGARRKVTVALHPHSHHTSLVLTAAEYDQVLRTTKPSGLMFNPDTGHIVRGGQDLLGCFRRHRARIVHVHCKDVDAEGRWKPMGEGTCDFRAVFGWLAETGYRGWLISEEESEAARRDVQAAIARNRGYFKSLGY